MTTLTTQATNSFTAGFIKQAQANGFTVEEAQRLLKKGGVFDWLDRTRNSAIDKWDTLGENTNAWWQDAGTFSNGLRAFGKSVHDLSPGQFENNFKQNVQDNALKMNNLYVDQMNSRIARNNLPGAYEARLKALQQSNQITDPNKILAAGNNILGATQAAQAKATATQQQQFNLSRSQAQLNSMNKMTLGAPPKAPMQQTAGFSVPQTPQHLGGYGSYGSLGDFSGEISPGYKNP